MIIIGGPAAYLQPHCVPGPTAFPDPPHSRPHRLGPTAFPAQLRTRHHHS